ncbi:MAG: HEPN domain-containing protein [Planctomycetes bacterium]|nr:HEPN domain-containing protein [Planctomycetota bacterium]
MMNNYETAIECLTQAEKRHETLPIMLFERDYIDVVRQSAAIMDLSLQSMLQFAGVEVRRHADLMPLVEGLLNRFPQLDRADLRRMREICRRLTVKRERTRVRVHANGSSRDSRGLSREDAVRAIEWSGFMVEAAQRVIKDFQD